ELRTSHGVVALAREPLAFFEERERRRRVVALRARTRRNRRDTAQDENRGAPLHRLRHISVPAVEDTLLRARSGLRGRSRLRRRRRAQLRPRARSAASARSGPYRPPTSTPSRDRAATRVRPESPGSTPSPRAMPARARYPRSRSCEGLSPIGGAPRISGPRSA